LNNITLANGTVNLNGNRLIGGLSAVNPSDFVIKSDITALSGVTNPMTGNASGASLYKFTNMINGSIAQDYVTLA
jgi:hypothetical protein